MLPRTRPLQARTPRAVDVSALLGVHQETRIVAQEISVPRGAGGVQCLLGLPHPALVVEGVVLRTVVLGVRASAELFGPGDVIVCPETEPPPFRVQCRVLTPTRLALLDERAMTAIAGDVATSSALAARLSRHIDQLALQSVLVQLGSIEERLGVLLPQLADRWGTVTHSGVLLPAFLSHTILAALVGVRRPSLTTAIAALATDRSFNRLPDRRWLVSRELAGLRAVPA